MYDFPSTDWKHGRYRVAAVRAENDPLLDWGCGEAREVANKLNECFSKAAELAGSGKSGVPNPIAVVEPIEVTGFEPLDPLMAAPPAAIADDGRRFEADAVVFCVGVRPAAGEIKESSDRFASFTYWQSEDPLWMNPTSCARQHVVLVGDGDGALADFVYLATGAEDFKLLIDALMDRLPAVSRTRWHRRAQRHVTRWYKPAGGQDVNGKLHAELLELADELWSVSGVPGLVEGWLAGRVVSSARVVLARPWFKSGYFANRLLSDLVARAILLGGGAPPLLYGCRAQSVLGTGCAADAPACAGHRHDIVLNDAALLNMPKPPMPHYAPAPERLRDVDRVLLRFTDRRGPAPRVAVVAEPVYHSCPSYFS